MHIAPRLFYNTSVNHTSQSCAFPISELRLDIQPDNEVWWLIRIRIRLE